MNSMQVNFPQTFQPETTKNLLYLSDLPSNITNTDLELFFKDFKNNIIVININPKRNDFNNNAATIIFKDYKIADMARRELNMKKIKGKTVRLMWHERDYTTRNNSQNNLFVKGIPFNVTPREVYEFFLQFGDIQSAKLNEDEEGNHIGYGYISYYQPESVDLAIQSCEGKEIWGTLLEIKHFQKKQERSNSFYPTNCGVYVKDFPYHYSEDSLRKIFSDFGEIIYVNKFSDSYNRPYATVCYKDEESAHKAKHALHGKPLENNYLYVDILMNKNERKKILSHKIMDSNQKLNQQFKFCNLHIRNIPYNVKEEDLVEAFKQFGAIKSVKIDKYMLVTKENNEFKEIPTSRGFGYICFENPESAQLAMETMNGKYLPGHETWKFPLLIEFFMPKQERVQTMKQQEQTTMNPMMGNFPMMQPQLQQQGFNMGGYPMNKPGFVGMGDFNNMGGRRNQQPQQQQQQFKQPQQQQQQQQFNQPQQQQQQFKQPQQQQQQYRQPMVNQQQPMNQQSIPQQGKQVQQSNVNKGVDIIDYQYFNSLEDEFSKRDYLGEIIFKKIEAHKLSQMNNFTIDIIGKITGMILGIEDMNEIIEISRDNENLTARIREALELLQLK
jgi:polyadenylate-binding protein